MADLSAITVKNTNPNMGEEETFVVLDASEIRRQASLIATILWKFWNYYNLRIFEGSTPDLILQSAMTSNIAKFEACDSASHKRVERVHQSEGCDGADAPVPDALLCSLVLHFSSQVALPPRVQPGWDASQALLSPSDPPVPEVIYEILDQPLSNDELKGRSDIPQTLEELMSDVKEGVYDVKAFAIKVREMVTFMEERTRLAKIRKYLYHHAASNSIPKQLHCLELRLADEHVNNAAARLQLPSAELVPALVDNNYFHFVLLSNNVLSASVVATSLVGNSLWPQKLVIHVITDKKSYYPMQAWFALHPLSPAIIEVKTLKHFDWFRNGNKVQALSPKFHAVMDNIMIHLPQMFPSLNKVVLLDDDIVVQTDLTPLWDIDMNGKVNGAVETCNGGDHNKLVMSKRFKNYLNFSHPLISNNFDPNQCAWAYGMNIFDLEAWRKTNISSTYHYWVEQLFAKQFFGKTNPAMDRFLINSIKSLGQSSRGDGSMVGAIDRAKKNDVSLQELGQATVKQLNTKSDLSLWKLKTLLPPTLIAFHGYVQIIDPFWHMLVGLGYNENTSLEDAKNAGVIHFNGRAKPWHAGSKF
ncbi:hypothetical protein PIB30_045718 [Stylosanthes scabra]|uniref:Hexosyltransferase n=1 Tax=Stylosanthes scabra TaxID=79078 RepID=A0ABU6WHD2_9FABA|nr:hypothetical protein [Stylosanthes scabra]